MYSDQKTITGGINICTAKKLWIIFSIQEM